MKHFGFNPTQATEWICFTAVCHVAQSGMLSEEKQACIPWGSQNECHEYHLYIPNCTQRYILQTLLFYSDTKAVYKIFVQMEDNYIEATT